MDRTIKVDVVLRSDAIEKPGGDTFQVEKYREHLTKLGFDFRLVPFRPNMEYRPGAIVHIVNVDRPFDFLASMRLAAGRPVVVSSIHHDLASVRLMRSSERGQGLRSIVGRFLPESLRELIAFVARNAMKADRASDISTLFFSALFALPHALTVWRAVGRALDRADAVAVLAEGEHAILMKDTGWKGLNGVLIPNGLPEGLASSGGAWHTRRSEICVVGRIEPRKRQLEVAQAATQKGAQVKFVGSPSPSSPRYVADFRKAISADPNLEWLGPLPHSEVMSIVSESKVLLNASWVEVQSLVDIEGASAGCWVVVGKGGNSKEWLEDNIVQVDTYEVDLILAKALEVLEQSVGPGGVAYGHTWSTTGDTLASTYEDVSMRRR